MKKLFNKRRQRKEESQQPSRITTDTLAEHRERILAGGRRFKYPVQYQRHKLVFNAIIVAVGAIILSAALGWWQLYIVQNSSEFMYRVTRVIPVPVASIDGEAVRYSDYLVKYRSALHYRQEKERIDLTTEDGQRQADLDKVGSLNDAIADAYARKLAREHNITISDVALEEALKSELAATGQTETAYYSTISDWYGWSPDEYREIKRVKLLRQQVAFAIDDTAQSIAQEVGNEIKAGQTDLQKLASSLNKNDTQVVVFGAFGWLRRDNQDDGLTAAAANLKKGQISEAVRSTTGEGYYYVKLLDSNDEQVKYEFIQIPLTTFKTQLQTTLDTAEKTKRYITMPDVQTQDQTQTK